MKISGCHRSETTAKAWLRIRGYISTVGKHGDNIMDSLRDAVTGNPWKPVSAENPVTVSDEIRDRCSLPSGGYCLVQVQPPEVWKNSPALTVTDPGPCVSPLEMIDRNSPESSLALCQRQFLMVAFVGGPAVLYRPAAMSLPTS
jgi:hypothetical protein